MKLYSHNKKIKKQHGFSIVELMIAIFIGIIILTGLVQVFDTSSKMNRTQNGLARIQENGRYALSLMKKNIEQTGYQYCMGESNAPAKSGAQPTKVAWDIQTTPFIPGFAEGPFDPAYLLRGHECDSTGGCTPTLNSLGANTSAAVPGVGTGNGNRLAGTDVLTIRYISGAGREIASINGNVLTFTNWSIANTPDAAWEDNGQTLVINCDTKANSPQLFERSEMNSSSITLTDAPRTGLLPKAFDMQRDFSTITYYVANNVVNGRDIPTLYSSVNGVTNAVIEGVDAFDVIYGVKDNTGAMRYLDAAGVQAFPVASCWPNVFDDINNTNIPNAAGCGWRSVVTIELHMLLNTIYNSSNNDNENFRYSQLGEGFLDQTDLVSGINHYSMHRKEFTTSIALKNIMQ